jgi:hypothetical protein
MPGRSYLMVNRNVGATYTIEFPDFDPLAPHLYPVTKDAVQVNAPWNDVVNTAKPHVLLFADEVSSELQIGDIIGVFSNQNICFGEIEYQGPGSFFRLVAMGNNTFSKDVDGFADGEMMKFVLYRQNTGEAYKIEFRYDNSYPNYDDKFATNGVSLVSGLTMSVTSVEEMFGEINVAIYPNPSSDVVNIKSNYLMKQITLINNVGQRLLTKQMSDNIYQIDVSGFAKGLYMVEIVTKDDSVIIRRLMVE